MIQVLPVSRCAPHLRDAHFLTILENTLESFSTDVSLPVTPVSHNSHPRDVSDSSETVQEEPPSRKRKRSAAISTPSKRAVVEVSEFAQLFDVVMAVVASIREKEGEHMQMVLKTNSAQAARILKYWLYTVQKLATVAAFPAAPSYTDLSLVVDLWDLRTMGAKDDFTASAEQFSTECLVPVLVLLQTLQQGKHTDRRAVVMLERLLAKHVLLPSRTAFFNYVSLGTEGHIKANVHKAEFLSSSLEPVRAKLLQAAQIADSGESIPRYLLSIYAAIPQLLELVIRSSPARTPKQRIAERPWVQAAFIALAECAGCSLEAPEFITPKPAINALQKCLCRLAFHQITLDSEILKKIFWFHSGLKFPLKQQRTINWPLIAALTELDPDMFLPSPVHRTPTSNPDDRPDDLAKFLFDQVSDNYLQGGNLVVENKMVVDEEEEIFKENRGGEGFTIEVMNQKIIVPIMFAFARNRNLRGFIDRWHQQLSNPLPRLDASIWEHQRLLTALASIFETSLTPVAIVNLIQGYIQYLEVQLKSNGPTTKESRGTDVVVQAVMQSVKSYEIIDTIKPQLLSLWSLYSLRVSTDFTASWGVLYQLLTHLWPTYLHGSETIQKQLLYPLVDQAASKVASAQEAGSQGHEDSSIYAFAMSFLFAACDCLQSLPGTDDFVRRELHIALDTISSRQIQKDQLAVTVEIFCSMHIQVLDVFDPDTCQALMYSLLYAISTFYEGRGQAVAETLSQSVFAVDSTALRAAFMSACLEALRQDDQDLLSTAVSCLLQAAPSAISREQREAILDIIVATLGSRAGHEIALLSVVDHIMTASNATAKLSSDGAVIFDLAQQLHDGNLESLATLQLLQSVAQSTVAHVLPNKDQTQNKRFLEKYKKKIASAMKKSRKCFPAKLAVLQGTFLAAYDDGGMIPVDRYMDLLIACLNDGTMPTEYILNALQQIPWMALRSNADDFKTAQTLLREWMASTLSLKSTSPIIEIEQFARYPKPLWPTIFLAMAKYQLCPNMEWLVTTASSFLCLEFPAKDKSAILSCIKETLLPLDTAQKLHLLNLCVSDGRQSSPTVSYHLLNTFVSITEDKLETDVEAREQQLALLPRLCSLLGESPDGASFNAVFDAITTIVRDKHALTSQYSIECVLTALLKIASPKSPHLPTKHAPAIFTRLCAMTRSILLLHRGRLGGRFHLLLPLLQNLLLCLFIPNGDRGSAHPPWLDSSSSNPNRLNPQNATQYTRLLSALCSPTQSSVQRNHHSSRSQAAKSKKELNDPVKAAREYASQFVYPLLSSYCRFQLYGRLDAAVRESLMAGIWDVVGVASLDRASLDSMFSGLGKSERDVWKEVWREWERMNKK
jgi:nucleolar pre-ribosomal-associated protein 2